MHKPSDIALNIGALLGLKAVNEPRPNPARYCERCGFPPVVCDCPGNYGRFYEHIIDEPEADPATS